MWQPSSWSVLLAALCAVATSLGACGRKADEPGSSQCALACDKAVTCGVLQSTEACVESCRAAKDVVRSEAWNAFHACVQTRSCEQLSFGACIEESAAAVPAEAGEAFLDRVCNRVSVCSFGVLGFEACRALVLERTSASVFGIVADEPLDCLGDCVDTAGCPTLLGSLSGGDPPCIDTCGLPFPDQIAGE